MTSDLRHHLADALVEDRLRLARERQLAGSGRQETDPVGKSSGARRRRRLRRLRRVLFSRLAGRVARPA